MENTTEDLLTERLYRVFSRYPFPSGMEGCPCCVSGEHLRLLRSKPLRRLGSEELSRYVFKAMTTWGTEDDFKYYLPRIFELYISGWDNTDTFLVLDKLLYGQWQKWPEEEQEAIRDYILNWWRGFAHTFSFLPKTIDRLYILFGDTECLLEPLRLDIHDENFRRFIDLAHDHYHDRDYSILKHWIHSQQELIEKAFFHFDGTDPLFARKISNTLYIVEHY